MKRPPDCDGCAPCAAYVKRRGPVILRAISERWGSGDIAARVLAHYLSGVHERHLAGLTLEATS